MNSDHHHSGWLPTAAIAVPIIHALKLLNDKFHSLGFPMQFYLVVYTFSFRGLQPRLISNVFVLVSCHSTLLPSELFAEISG